MSATTMTSEKQSDVTVRLDDRVRLLGAVLAATNYPEQMQKIKPHGTHAHARATIKHIQDHREHPAVKSTQELLDKGTPIEALFTLMLMIGDLPDLSIGALPPWAPAGYNDQLRDFYTKANLAEFWETDNMPWDKALKETTAIFSKVEFKDFLQPFLGDVVENFTFIPSVSYPSNHDLGLQLPNELVVIAPPPLAWGDSPPWSYDEPTMVTHSYQVALSMYSRILLRNYMRSDPEKLAEITQNELPVADHFKAQHPTWEEQFSALFSMAAVAMYFETHVGELDYKSYVLLQKKAHGMALLPGTVSVMRRYLQEVGNRYQNLLEFLPVFPKQLRVAQKIVTL